MVRLRCLGKVSKPQYRHKKKKNKLRIPLEIGENVLLLSSRIKKKDSPGLFYKRSTDNR